MSCSPRLVMLLCHDEASEVLMTKQTAAAGKWTAQLLASNGVVAVSFPWSCPKFFGQPPEKKSGPARRAARRSANTAAVNTIVLFPRPDTTYTPTTHQIYAEA